MSLSGMGTVQPKRRSGCLGPTTAGSSETPHPQPGFPNGRGIFPISNASRPTFFGVPLRSNSILQARVRASQFRELQARRRAGLLRGLMFVHLKQDLGAEPVDWLECQDPSEPARRDPLLPYGIQREVQRRLAAIRTDLDSFSEIEAYALMTSGYCMTARAMEQGALDSPLPKATREPWPFLEIEQALRQPGTNTPLMRQLQVADKLVFKVWLLSRSLQLAGGIALLTLLVVLAILSWLHWSTTAFSLTVGALVTTLVCLGLGAAGWGPLVKTFQYRKTFQSILIGGGRGTSRGSPCRICIRPVVSSKREYEMDGVR